jgi:hypothetical protein
MDETTARDSKVQPPVATVKVPSITHHSLLSYTISMRPAIATFSIEIPRTVAEIILDKESDLKNYGKSLKKGCCSFEAGFDLLPSDCWLVLGEQWMLIQGSVHSPPFFS